MITKEQLDKLASECHISAAGILKARIFNELIPGLTKRRNEKRVTEFEEQQIQNRINPFLLMHSAATIIVIITSYYTHPSQTGCEQPKFYGEIARFARGRDYHQVLHDQMSQLGKKLKLISPTFEWQSYTDTGPLIDRYLAAQAGLGIYGRNNCLIHPKFGSFFVIGYMLVNEPFDESMDKIEALQPCMECGNCQRACPVQALETPFQIDPDRCLSHQLQRREQIPPHLRSQAGLMLYGCDICQNVCPHNQGIPVTRHPDFQSEANEQWLDLKELLHLTGRAFDKRYRSRAFGWRGHKVMQRNALMALSHFNSPESADLIKPFLAHIRPEFREMAQWALVQYRVNTLE
jgi:epoxyqueuosine reductase